MRIGANATVVGNINIGHNSVIGAGSVVAKDVEEWSTMIGNPAYTLKKHSILR
jgi:acetyltransferase-like isoleucine patch superfamily enzyme